MSISRLIVAGGQILGQRREQQDRFGRGIARLRDGRSAPVLVLADGMGGHEGGALAAQLAVQAFLDVAEVGDSKGYPELLEKCLLVANRAIGEHARDRPQFFGMGTTLLAAIPENGQLHYISVGDSAFLRLKANGLERINADHSMAPLIDVAAARGELDLEDADVQSQRSALRSALVGSTIALVDAQTIDIRSDQWMLLASDGLLSIDPPRIAQVIVSRAPAGVEAVAAGLLRAVEEVALADQDNCTVVAFKVAEGAGRFRYQALSAWLLISIGISIVAAASALLATQELRVPAARTKSPTKSAEPATLAMPRPDRAVTALKSVSDTDKPDGLLRVTRPVARGKQTMSRSDRGRGQAPPPPERPVAIPSASSPQPPSIYDAVKPTPKMPNVEASSAAKKPVR